MSNTCGTAFRFTVFGQSHGQAIGVTMEGLPIGFAPDMDELQTFLNRRAPGQNELSTARKEEDRPVFLSGLHEGAVCGAPVTAVIYNHDAKSADYNALAAVPRPGHADWPAMARFGDSRDYAGGGQFSGRLTAPLCIAGGLCLQLLQKRGIRVSAWAERIGGQTDPKKMQEAVARAKADGDSVGGVIACRVTGLPAGIGEPMFGGVENAVSQAVFGIPGVKGIEFGSGFAGSELHGSENNDAFVLLDGILVTETNRCGGILGGMTTGMPVELRVAVKPTPSIAKMQKSVSTETCEAVDLSVPGRHDPCIVPRAVPCVEAAVAAAVYDLLLQYRLTEE